MMLGLRPAGGRARYSRDTVSPLTLPFAQDASGEGSLPSMSAMSQGTPKQEAARWVTGVGVPLVVIAIGVAALLVGAARGNSTVTSLTSASQMAATDLDNAYYRCLDVQAQSLVMSGQVVNVSGPGNVADLLRAAGSWLKAAPAGDVAAPVLRIVERSGPGTCHGSVVEGAFPNGRGGHVVRIGSGASVPGAGALPRPQL